MFHWVPVEEERRMISLPLAPVKVSVPETVWVVPAVKVRLSPAVVSVKLLKVVEPDMAWAEPFKVTVPELGVNVPPELDQLPDTLKLPEALGAVKVPDDSVTLVVVTVPDDPVNVPPDTVKPPFKVWVPLDAK